MTTPQQIRVAMAQLADIIDRSPDGDKYMPIFDRLESELGARNTRAARLDAARRAVEVRA